jgi:hypothetical protein
MQKQHGTWLDMSAATPIRYWWASWLRGYWTVLIKAGRVADRSTRGGALMRWLLGPTPVGKLKRLAMIGWARWSIVVRAPKSPRTLSPTESLPTLFEGLAADAADLISQESRQPLDRVEKPSPQPRKQSRRLDQPYLLFDSNFTGGQAEYLEAFAAITPWGMRLTWGRAYGFPNPARVTRFVDYVSDATTEVTHQFCGYDASPKAILIAGELRRRLERFAKQVEQHEPAAFRREWNELLTKVQSIRKPWPPAGEKPYGCRTVLSPVDKNRKDDLKQTIKQHLEGRKDHLPATTHFARWVYVPWLQDRDPNKKIDMQFLLFSAWYDGEHKKFLDDLYHSIGEPAVSAIWGLAGLKGSDYTAFEKHMCKYTISEDREQRLSDFGGYPGVSVKQIRGLIPMADRFRDLAAESAALSDDELLEQWRDFVESNLTPVSELFTTS